MTVGPWLTSLLRSEFAAKADYVQFPVDHTIYRPDAVTSAHPKPRVVYLAKPDTPRRCYLLGLEMLRDLHRKIPEVEIILFGSNETDSHQIPFEHTNLGVIKDLQEATEGALLQRNSGRGVFDD